MKVIENIQMFLIVACAMLAVSCTNEPLVDNSNIESGIPVTAKLSFSVPASSEVTVTRASSYSEVRSVVLFVYTDGGAYLESVERFAAGDLTESTGSDRKYSLTLQTTTGEKRIVGIANPDGQSWENLNTLIGELEAKTKTMTAQELEQYIVNLQSAVTSENRLPDFSGTSMLLTGADDFTINKTSITPGTLDLKRNVAEVIFNITSGKDAQGNEIEFNPSTYQVFNVPVGTRIGDSGTPIAEGGITYYNSMKYTAPTITDGSYTLTFFMPENIQAAGKNAAGTGYQERDKWGDGVTTNTDPTAPDEKVWVNAPQKSTFIVISGSFNAMNASGVLVQTGSVSYTIHLGDFSTATGAMNNYSVARNWRYTYNINIIGVDNIVAEAKSEYLTDEKQPGAEGGVINVGNYTQDYTLDAHYEQVFLEYNLTQMAQGLPDGSDDALAEAIGNRLLLILETPFTKSGTEYLSPYLSDYRKKTKAEVMKNQDYEWIEFYPQTEKGTADNDKKLATYPGLPTWKEYENGDQGTNTRLIDAYDLCVALGKAVFNLQKNGSLTVTSNNPNSDKICIVQENNNYYARFTAFVDEYYYNQRPDGTDGLTWGEYVNVDMRRMMIAMNVDISPDGNSQSVELYSNISQRAMQTFYNKANAENIDAFGIEAYNENPLFTNSSSSYGSPKGTGAEMSNGYMNTWNLLGGYSSATFGTSWSLYVQQANNGYLRTNTSANQVKSHKINNMQPNGENYAYRACMSRNRDLNGDGLLAANELRWYMPAVHEYIRIAMGSGAIASESQLYHGDKASLSNGSYPDNVSEYGSLYYTSTNTTENNMGAAVYWNLEKGSYGQMADAGYGRLAVRCIRHLPNLGGTMVDNPSPFYTLRQMSATSGGNYVLDYRGILQPELLRATTITTGYVVHNDDSHYNRFYKGMVVAKDYIRDGEYVKLYNIDDVTDGSNPCAEYSETRSDAGKWRVPNQVELTSMTSRINLFFKDQPTKTENGTDIFQTSATVQHTYWGVFACTQFSNMAVRNGFAFRGIVCSCPDFNAQGGIRCVRDATDDELESPVVPNQ